MGNEERGTGNGEWGVGNRITEAGGDGKRFCIFFVLWHLKKLTVRVKAC